MLKNELRETQRACVFRPQYVLSDKIWLEYWPTDGECQTAQHRWTCEEMQELLNQLLVFGCQM